MKHLCIFLFIFILISELVAQCPRGYVKVSDDHAALTPFHYHPRIHDGTIVWSQRDQDTVSHIFMNSGSGPVQVVTGNKQTENFSPDIFGSTIAYQKTSGSSQEIYKYSGSGEILVSTGTSTDNDSHDIYDNTIVWRGIDGSSSKVYKNTGNGQVLVSTDLSVPDNFTPRIDNSTIVWGGYDGTIIHVYKDTGSGPQQVSTDNTIHNGNPDVMGNTIVWGTASIPFETDETKYQIYKSVSGGPPILVSTGSSTVNREPRIHGNTIVWEGWDGNNIQIYKNSGSGQELVSSGLAGDHFSPEIHNNTIVWRNFVTSTTSRIYKDDGTGPQLLSDLNDEVSSNPVVYDGIISWSAREHFTPYVYRTQSNILTNTWTGATDSYWESSNNWSLGIAPDYCHDVVIPSGSDVKIDNTSYARGYTLTINSNAQLENEEGGMFNINNQ